MSDRADSGAPAAHQPYVPDRAALPELTWPAVLVGAVLGIIFGASSLYLVLKVGMTVSASIPVAVLSITLFRGFSRAFGTRRATILESSAVCPACRHHLRYGVGADAPPASALTPLRIEGSIRHPAEGEPWEYTVVVSIRNDRDEVIARKLIGVGAMDPNEQRTFTLSVEAVLAKAASLGKGRARH